MQTSKCREAEGRYKDSCSEFNVQMWRGAKLSKLRGCRENAGALLFSPSTFSLTVCLILNFAQKILIEEDNTEN